jgi:RNA polymerase sigma-70 factor (ECF subfamily)
LLREVFDFEYAEIATILGKSEIACRQWFSKAKKHLTDHRPRFPASPDLQKQLLTSFLQAVHAGDMSALIHLLAEEVTFWSDGGGKVPGTATQPITGRDAVARYFMEHRGVFRGNLPATSHTELMGVNGQLALVTRSGSRAIAVLTIEVEAGHIRAIRAVANPEKLTHV